MYLDQAELIQFDMGMGDPSMELASYRDEHWVTYIFTGFDPEYRLDVEALEVSIREFVADSRYAVYDYEILDFTHEEYPAIEINLGVEINKHDKTEADIFDELWPITKEITRISPEEYAL